MIRDICKDEAFLAQRAQPATPDDLQAAADLLETRSITGRAAWGWLPT